MGQALLPTQDLRCILNNLLTKTPSPTSTSNPFSSLTFSPSWSFRRLQQRSLKCSIDYNNGQAVFPKPSQLPWKKELCNSVHLIGNVGRPVEIKHLPSGKVVAWTSLAVKKSATDTSWINLTFWDDLAQVASQHVEKGQQIYVCGRLVSDTVETEDGKQQTYYKVVVQQLNFIEKNFAPATSYDQGANSTSPGRKFGNYNANNSSSVEELWQAFFVNPVDWWDNRMNKRSPKHPDFKHKDTGEALWVEGRNNPPWVKSQLEILDERMGSLHNQNANRHANFMGPDDFAPF